MNFNFFSSAIGFAYSVILSSSIIPVINLKKKNKKEENNLGKKKKDLSIKKENVWL